jgi:hypothetical protein
MRVLIVHYIELGQVDVLLDILADVMGRLPPAATGKAGLH